MRLPTRVALQAGRIKYKAQYTHPAQLSRMPARVISARLGRGAAHNAGEREPIQAVRVEHIGIIVVLAVAVYTTKEQQTPIWQRCCRMSCPVWRLSASLTCSPQLRRMRGCEHVCQSQN